jgi:hypothetical protein
MSLRDTSVPLPTVRWGSFVTSLPHMVALPGVHPESLRNIGARWQGFLTTEMRQLLQITCGLSGTPIGNIDFTGCWYPEEPLALFRPCLTLAVDAEGRRWIAEAGRTRGLPGPVWCIDPDRRVALYVARRLQDFLRRLDHYSHRGQASLWNVSLAAHARRVWLRRYASATHVYVASRRLREIRGWLGRLPQDAWIYDLRAPGSPRGLPCGLARDPTQWIRCGRLPIFALCRERDSTLETAELAMPHSDKQAASSQ